MNTDSEFVFDGIEEQQGTVPNWWKHTFLCSLLFCPFYFIVYNTGAPGRSMTELYDTALAESSRKRLAEMGELKADEKTILRVTAKESWVKVGKVVFKQQCASCHGQAGEGLVGPNLTDEAYKHVRSIEDIGRVILQGANNNAMPAWKDKLEPNEIVLVAAYVASIRGTNVSGGKGAEGSEIDPWPPVPPPEDED